MGLMAILGIIAGLAPALGLAGDLVQFNTALVPVIAQQIQQRNAGGNCCQCCQARACDAGDKKRLVMHAGHMKQKIVKRH